MGGCFSTPVAVPSATGATIQGATVRVQAAAQRTTAQITTAHRTTAGGTTANTPSLPPALDWLPTRLCTICQNISLTSLPSEDEPGQPHQASLAALKASAATCTLCAMILGAAMRIREDINEEFNGKGKSRFQTFSPPARHQGRMRTVRTHAGVYAAGTEIRTGPRPNEPEPAVVDPKQFPFADDHAVRPWLFGSWWDLGLVEAGPPQLVGLGVRLGRSAAIEHGEGNSAGAEEDIVVLRGTFLRVRTRADSPSASYIPGRLVAANSSSPFAYQRIRAWLDDCDSSHPCLPVKEMELPTRVLDVGVTGSAKVTLVEGAGRRARYVALSHRWGLSHRITLTKATCGSLMAGVELAALPKTFSDAVHLARTLDIRYLWIDSLCIVQDDAEDWEREAARMASVYLNSYLTVAASFSEDDSSGCFPPWSLRCESACIPTDVRSHGIGPIIAHAAPLLSALGTDADADANGPQAAAYLAMSRFAVLGMPNGRAADVTVSEEWMPSSMKNAPHTYAIPSFGRPFDMPGLQPLATRGWTLQERLLSPRTLHFCPDQMYWECPLVQLAEDGSRITERKSHLSRLINTQLQPPEMHGLRSADGMSLIEGYPPSIESNPTGRWNGGWLALVEDYMTRGLTKADDKLVALSGLAKLLAGITKDEYIAGLWVGHLLEDLFWRVKARVEVRIQVSGGFEHQVGDRLCWPKRPARYRAPTWSWAALDDAHVEFVPLDFGRRLTTYVACAVAPATENAYGRVTDGRLLLRGPLLSVRRAPPEYQPDKEEPLGFGVPMMVQTAGGLAFGEAYFDVETEKRDQCMGLFLDPSNALLLQPVDDEPDNGLARMFTRLGTAKFLRTCEQRQAEPLYDHITSTLNKVPYGPVTSRDSISRVLII